MTFDICGLVWVGADFEGGRQGKPGFVQWLVERGLGGLVLKYAG